MNEGTSVLLGLEDEFTVLQLERIDADTVRVVIEVIDPEGACPECGVLTSRIKERPLVRVKDLPASGQRTDLWWLKRRLVCREPACGTATIHAAVPRCAGTVAAHDPSTREERFGDRVGQPRRQRGR